MVKLITNTLSLWPEGQFYCCCLLFWLPRSPSFLLRGEGVRRNSLKTLVMHRRRQPTTTEIPTLPISHRMVQERIFMSTTQPSLRGQRPESKRFPWAEQIYDDCFILFFSHYSVPTLNTSWLHLFDLIGKIPSNLENILNRIVSETLILISIYVKGNSLSHVMEQSRGDPASDKSYFRRFKCHILD